MNRKGLARKLPGSLDVNIAMDCRDMTGRDRAGLEKTEYLLKD